MGKQILNEAPPPGTISHAPKMYSYTAYRRQLGIEPMMQAPAKAHVQINTKTDLDKKDNAEEFDTSRKGKEDLPFTYAKAVAAARKKETRPMTTALEALETSEDIDAAVKVLDEAMGHQVMEYLKRIITRYGKAADDHTLANFVKNVRLDRMKARKKDLVSGIAQVLGLDDLVAGKLYDVASQLVH